jgi:hypothetical protein
MASFNGDMGVSFQNRKLEALRRLTSYLKAAGGLPGQRAVSMRSMGMTEEVPRPPRLSEHRLAMAGRPGRPTWQLL